MYFAESARKQLESFTGCEHQRGQWSPASVSTERELVSSLWAQDWFDASSFVKNQICRTVAPCNAGLVARANLVPVVTCFHTSWTTGIINCTVFTLGCWKAVKRNKICVLHRVSQGKLCICLLGFYCKYIKKIMFWYEDHLEEKITCKEIPLY